MLVSILVAKNQTSKRDTNLISLKESNNYFESFWAKFRVILSNSWFCFFLIKFGWNSTINWINLIKKRSTNLIKNTNLVIYFFCLRNLLSTYLKFFFISRTRIYLPFFFQMITFYIYKKLKKYRFRYHILLVFVL